MNLQAYKRYKQGIPQVVVTQACPSKYMAPKAPKMSLETEEYIKYKNCMISTHQIQKSDDQKLELQIQRIRYI